MTKKEFLRLKPSQLLRVAVADLKKVEKDERYVVDMDRWHRPLFTSNSGGIKCHVCLAGSALAKSLGISPDEPFSCLDIGISDKFKDRMSALNYFRCGAVVMGLHNMGINDRRVPAELTKKLPIVEYKSDKKKFKRQMLGLARKLEKHNL